MVDSFITLSKSNSSRASWQFLDARLLRKATKIQMLSENTLNPFALEMESLLDNFFFVNFVVDMARCRDA